MISNGRGAFAVWTSEEVAEGLRLRAEGLGYRKVAMRLGRTEQAVRHRIFRERLVDNQDRRIRVAYSKADRAFLAAFRDLYPDALAQSARWNGK